MSNPNDDKQRPYLQQGQVNPELEQDINLDRGPGQGQENDVLKDNAQDHNPATPLDAVEHELAAARKERDAHIAGGAPNVFEGDKRNQWMAQRDELNQRVDAGQVRLMEAAESATPEQIAATQEKMKEQMEQQPQDNAQQATRSPFSKLLAARRPAAEWVDQAENEAEAPVMERDRPAVRTAHGMENYAATEQAEADNRRENERMHAAYRDHNIGSGQATQGEVEDWWAKHHAEQAQQPQTPDHAEQQRLAREEREWNDRFLSGRGR